jgi:hypothetical protein
MKRPARLPALPNFFSVAFDCFTSGKAIQKEALAALGKTTQQVQRKYSVNLNKLE